MADKPKSSGKTEVKRTLVANNKKAYHEYHVLETFKAGIVLTGTEIKSIRRGRATINQAFARIEKGEVFIHGMHIAPYEQGTHYNHDPDRVRKLLMKKSEIKRLLGKTSAGGARLETDRFGLVGAGRWCIGGRRRRRREEDMAAVRPPPARWRRRPRAGCASGPAAAASRRPKNLRPARARWPRRPRGVPGCRSRASPG